MPLQMPALDGLGPALALLAEHRGLSRADLARGMKVKNPTVTKMLRQNSKPNTATVERVLDLLGADAHDLARALDFVNGRAANEVREVESKYLADARANYPTRSADYHREMAELYQRLEGLEQRILADRQEERRQRKRLGTPGD